MENNKEKINEFLKKFEGKEVKSFEEIYNELIAYGRDINQLKKRSNLYDNLSYDQRNEYRYDGWHLKEGVPLFARTTEDDYEIAKKNLITSQDSFDYLLMGVLSGRDSHLGYNFFAKFFRNNIENVSSFESDEKFMNYLNKIQSIIESNEGEFDYNMLSLLDKEKLNHFKSVIKFLKENKRARDSILIAKKIKSKENLEKRYDVVIYPTFNIGAKVFINNSMDGFICVSVFGSQRRNLKHGPIIKLYMTIKEDKIDDVMSDLGAYLLKNDIRCFYKTRPEEANDMLTVRIDELEKLDGLVDWLKNNKNIYFSNHPFMPNVDGIAMTFDEGGSYNKFISESIYSYIKSSKNNLSYEGFINFLKSEEYLKSLDDDEKKRFYNNLKIALTGQITINDFKEKYIDNVKDYKLNQEIKDAFNKFENGMMYNDQIYDDKTLLASINAGLDEIRVKYNFKDMDNEELLLSYYGKEKEDFSSMIDYVFEIITSSKGSTSTCEFYYLGKILEKWNALGGRKKIEEGLNAFRCISEKLGDYSNMPQEYITDYKYLIEKAKRKNYISSYSLEFDLRKIINYASKQFGLERNSKDSKAYAIRKIYKKKKELQEND